MIYLWIWYCFEELKLCFLKFRVVMVISIFVVIVNFSLVDKFCLFGKWKFFGGYFYIIFFCFEFYC